MDLKALIVGVDLGESDLEYSLNELENLAKTAEIDVISKIQQKLDRVNPATYIGKGKVDEVKSDILVSDIELVIFNDELSPAQLRNLEALLEVKVIDRTLLILDIFAKRATSKEAMLQIEIAQLKYMLPRLIGLGKSLSRQAGGIGTRGPGEKKLELDRRRIEKQISIINKELQEAAKTREIQIKRRNKNKVPTVALVGYTNAGKSTLMNRLIQDLRYDDYDDKHVYAEDKLFATLDTTIRSLKIDHKKFLLIDTVGFVSRLPHHLVQAFYSTLDEVLNADLILHVVDSVNSNHEKQIDITNKVLDKIGVKNKPVVYVFNKIDQVDEIIINKNDYVKISAKTGLNIDELVSVINERLFDNWQTVELLIPYTEAALFNQIKETFSLKEFAYKDDGIFIRAEIENIYLAKYKKYII